MDWLRSGPVNRRAATNMVRELTVYLLAERAGSLALAEGKLKFCYTPEWLVHPAARALSASLPLQAEHLGRATSAALAPSQAASPVGVFVPCGR